MLKKKKNYKNNSKTFFAFAIKLKNAITRVTWRNNIIEKFV